MRTEPPPPLDPSAAPQANPAPVQASPSTTPAAAPAGAPSAAQPKVDRAKFPLGLKLTLLTVCLATLPLGGVGVGLIAVNRDTVVLLSREVQISVIGDLARTIDQEFVEAQDALDMTGALFTDPTLDDETRVQLISSQVQGLEAIDHVALYDGAGNRIAVIADEESSLELPETLSQAMRDEIEELHHSTGDVALFDGEARALVAVRIRVDGATTGYVASLVSMEDVQARVEAIAGVHFPEQENALFVVDHQLRTVAHNNRERAATLSSAADEGILEGVTAEMLSPTFNQSGEFTAADGVPMLASSRGLEGQPWAIVAQVPQSVAYASLTRMTYIVIGTVVGAILIALILGLFFARRISAPLAELTRFARALAQRQWDDRAAVNTSDELAVLSRTMNRAAGELQESESRIKKEVAIRTDLGRYIPSALVEQIVRRESDMGLGGNRRNITVMFADVVGFTPMTDQLAPEHVVAILNELFTILTEIVFRHNGTVDKFVGDCVMALFGAPTEQSDHAQRAIEAAEDMLSWLETGNERWQEKYGVTIQLAIGIHTGDAVVGNIGSEKRMEYTAIGDVVNVAARLEAIARPQQILVTEAVVRAAGEDYDFNDADLHRLSGRAEPVHLYEVAQ